MEIYSTLLTLSIISLGLLAVSFFRYVQKTKQQIAKQQEIITASSTTQNRLFAILGQEVRKPILAFRDISKKIDFLVTHKEFDTLKKLGVQLDENATDLNLVLENLLIWSQTHKKNYNYQPQPIPVKQILEELTESFSGIVEKKGIALSTSFEEAAHLNADLNSLMLLLKNILTKIIQLSSKEHPLDIQIVAPSNFILINISSLAIPPNFLENSTKNTIENFDPQFLKDLILLNRGKIERTKSVNKTPIIRLSFPRG